MSIYVNNDILENHAQYLEYIENRGINGITSLILMRSNDYIGLNDVLHFTNLRDLTISSNDIYNLDLSIIPENLTNLILYNNKLIDILLPEINSLIILFLTNNLLSKLNYQNLRSLEILCISQNNIKDIDESISCLQNLNTLYMFENKITNISPLENLTNLTNLSIGKNFISSIPYNFFCKVSKLKELNISNNCISTIPDNITNCTDLNYLCIKNNQISHLPKDIGNLRKLKIFEFDNNYIETYPNSFCYLDLEYPNYYIRKIKDELTNNILKNFKNSYYRAKFGKRLDMLYVKNVKNKNLYFEIMHVLYCPDYNFYLRFLDKDVISYFKQN